MTTNEIDGFPQWTDPDDAPVLTAAEAPDVEVYKGSSFIRRGEGQPGTADAKELVSIRLSQVMLTRLRATGPGWQARVEPLLARAIMDHPELVAAGEVVETTTVGLTVERSDNAPTARKMALG